MKWLALILTLAAGSMPAQGAAYLAFTNTPVEFARTNWDGAFDLDRLLFGTAGDSMLKGYTAPPGSVTITTSLLIATLLSRPDARQTNNAEISENYSHYYQRATNLLALRRPNVLIFGPPINDLGAWVNDPTGLWNTILISNNLLVAKAREVGSRVLFVEFCPQSTDYHPVVTNYNERLNDWSPRSTNSDVARVAAVWDFFKSDSDPAFMKDEYTDDDRHHTPLGQTNYALIIATNLGYAMTVYPASGSMANVSNAVHHIARNGDTVELPSGTSTWTNQLTIYKSITLKGQGIGNTIIRDGRNTYGQYVIRTELTNARTTRITGIEWNDNGGIANVALWLVHGTDRDMRRFRFDHNRAGIFAQRPFFETYGVLGVVDHNIFLSTNQLAFLGEIMGSSFGYTQGTAAWGDGAWTNTLGFSTERFLFFEDNYITNFSETSLTMLDGHSGTRYVFRNNVSDGGSLEIHGGEASRTQSGHAYEIYNNTITATGARTNSRSSPIYMRGGVGRIASNNISGWTTSASFSVLDNRSIEHLNYPFNGSDGRNPWDINNANNPHVMGTCSSAGTLTMTDASKNWTNNFWAGFALRKTGSKSVSGITRSGDTATATVPSHGFANGSAVSIQGAAEYGYNGKHTITVLNGNQFTYSLQNLATPASPATGTMFATTNNHFALITGNTSDTITFRAASFNSATFLAGETYEINKVDQAMDQIGVTGGADLGGVNYPTPSNTQTVSAWYEWANTREGGADVDFSNTFLGGTFAVIVIGTHVIDDTVPPGFTGFYPYPHWLVTGESTAEGGGGEPEPPAGDGPAGTQAAGLLNLAGFE